jgi:hypothetical protein
MGTAGGLAAERLNIEELRAVGIDDDRLLVASGYGLLGA